MTGAPAPVDREAAQGTGPLVRRAADESPRSECRGLSSAARQSFFRQRPAWWSVYTGRRGWSASDPGVSSCLSRFAAKYARHACRSGNTRQGRAFTVPKCATALTVPATPDSPESIQASLAELSGAGLSIFANLREAASTSAPESSAPEICIDPTPRDRLPMSYLAAGIGLAAAPVHRHLHPRQRPWRRQGETSKADRLG